MPDSFQYTFTDNIPAFLAETGATLWVTTYQAGKLAVFREKEGGLSLLLRTFDKAMGLALDHQRLSVGTRFQIWNLRNEPNLAPKMEPKGERDACFLPRTTHITGNIDIHEMAWCGEELWFVNSLYSCLCTLSPDSSFVPRWRPAFISELRKHDRCHLNGLAIADGRPAYATALAACDEPGGWRQDAELKRTGGIVMSVESHELVATGLSMPHSPRVYADKLWVLDSGNGALCTVEPDGAVQTVAKLPGYPRGLDFLGRYAMVGLSRIRESAVFGGVAVSDQPEAHRQCGVWFVDIVSGEIAGSIQFEETVDEVFEVKILPGIRYPAVVGPTGDGIEKHCIIGEEWATP